MRTQRSKDPSGRTNAKKLMRPRRQYHWIGKTFEADHEDLAPRCTGSSRHLGRKSTPSGEDTQRRPRHHLPTMPPGSDRDDWEHQ